MSDDPYKALGVSKTATQAEIKKAYKKIARTSHPDINPGDVDADARFKAATAANDLLKDPKKRARFDAGEIDASGAEKPERRYYREYAGGPDDAYSSNRGFEDFGSQSDIFNDLFGRRGAGGTRAENIQMRGQDLHYSLEVAFLDAVRGASPRITLPGGGTIEVKIPQGISDGQTLRLRGKGGEGYGGGPAGDALVTVTVLADKVFRREDDDILIDLPISIDEAILGAKVETPTITGNVKLTVPKGASSGQTLRLRGRGVKRRDGTNGDQRVSLRIISPPEIDDELATFIKGWAEKNRYNPREGMRS
jgi:DnaJ-class molecular chaperone